MNETIKNILKWIPSHLSILLIGLALLWLFKVTPLLTNNEQYKSELKIERDALATASSTLVTSKQQLDKANTNLKNATTDNKQLKEQLAGAQSTISGLSSELGKAKGLIDTLTTSTGELGSGAEESIRLATAAQNEVRGAINIIANSTNNQQ